MTSRTIKLTLATACACLAAAAPASAVAPSPASLSLSLLASSSAGVEGGAEISAFHAPSKRLFTTDAANNELDIRDLSVPAVPADVSSVDLAPYGAAPNSVTVSPRCGGRVVVAMEAAPATSAGTLELFDTSGNHLDSVVAGALPDMVSTTPSGLRFLVANEGEPADDGLIDPEGSVTIASLHGCSDLRAKQVSFAGVPTIGPVRAFTPGATFAQDMEPEYITIGRGERTAMVTLQENNAVAQIDVLRGKVDFVRSLGFKNHGQAGNGLDPSDKDSAVNGGVNIATYDNVFGMFQPDAIASYRLPGDIHPRYITANEGDSRDYDFFSEESRVKSLSLDPSAFPAALKADAKLGRLNVTTTLGDTDGDLDYDQLYAFGARSVSILGHDGTLTWDSGDDFEQYVAANDLTNWNVEEASGNFDGRSDNKGPEPEGVTVGKVRNRMYAFTIMERQGGIFALDLRSTPGQARIAGYINTRAVTTAPEGIIFIPAHESPTGHPLLVTTNELSGNVGIYEVRV
jgi:hypothetical protein